MRNYVYVVGMDGKPLMPTKRCGWVRRTLNTGKAKVVSMKPFTIQLFYEPETHEVQPVRAAVDPGRTNIGLAAIREDGKCLYRCKVETRNKEIPKLVGHRKTHRQASRRGERLARKRLAKRLGTTLKKLLKRRLPGYKGGYVEVKDIINTEAKFNNRKRPKGWITPTARQLLQTHQSALRLMEKILPVSSVAVEINRFDFAKMDNPKIRRYEYGKGPLKGHGSTRKALIDIQDGKCLLCKKSPIEHDHHIIPRSRGGSDTLANLAGLCLCCHEKVHTDIGAAERLSRIKNGQVKKYGALSVLNQIIGRFVDWTADRYLGRAFVTNGWCTKAYREANRLDKDHDIDAYCIGMATIGCGQGKADTDMPPCFHVKQYRRHDRAIINNQPCRAYYYRGALVAHNRRKAIEVNYNADGTAKETKQTYPSLQDWYHEMVSLHGDREALKMLSQLKVRASFRRYNDTKRLMPGAIIEHDGTRYIKQGQITGGVYYTVYGDNNLRIGAKDCIVRRRNTGLVYM